MREAEAVFVTSLLVNFFSNRKKWIVKMIPEVSVRLDDALYTRTCEVVPGVACMARSIGKGM